MSIAVLFCTGKNPYNPGEKTFQIKKIFLLWFILGAKALSSTSINLHNSKRVPAKIETGTTFPVSW
jgi:hypothetical protein